MMSKITINIDFLAGTELKEAVKEAKEKAYAWGVAYICFSFNGVKFSIGRNCNVSDAVNEYGEKDRDSRLSIVHS
jgi:hypothetical protein